MSIEVGYAATCTVAETLDNNTDSAEDSLRKVTHKNFNESATLNADSTPPATKVAEFIATLSSGALTINLTSLTGTNGASVDGTGLKVQVLRVKNLGAAALTIAEGASNGYSIFGSSGQITIPPGAHFQFFSNDGTPDIAAGDRTLDLTGTAAQTSEWTIVMG